MKKDALYFHRTKTWMLGQLGPLKSCNCPFTEHLLIESAYADEWYLHANRMLNLLIIGVCEQFFLVL